jgi:hypothetical protein
MANVSLLDAARALKQKTVSGMVKKVGLPWPPTPFVSLRNLECLALNSGAVPILVPITELLWKNWGIIDGPNPGYLFGPTFWPNGPNEIANAIRHAEAAGKTIRAQGSGWSFSDVSLPQSSAVAIKFPDSDPFYCEERAGEFATAADAEIPLNPGLATTYRAEEGQWEEMAKRARTGEKELEPHFGYGIELGELANSLQPLLPQFILDHVDAGSLFFVEGGITLAALNSMLDKLTPPLALKTLGGSDGQSLAGAISTGTHGGDFDRPPLADSVRAIYLIGAQGTHHWIEPTKPITDPDKIVRTFPCIRSDNVHYDDDMFRAVLVSMGSMGVIYAFVLDVVPQYSLLHWNKWSTWEELRHHSGKELFDGSWTGMKDFVDAKFPPSHFGELHNRFLQVVVDPIKNDDGTHNCYVSNRVELPSTVPPSGVKPVSKVTEDEITNAIQHSPDFHIVPAGIVLKLEDFHGAFTLPEKSIVLINLCQSYGYFWAIRAVIELLLQKSFPLPSPLPNVGPSPNINDAPQINKGHIVMTGGGALGSSYPIFGITSIEPALAFTDSIAFIDALLDMFDSEVTTNKFPGGYISLRVTGQTKASLGMQQFERTGAVEVSLLGTADAFDLIKKVESMALAKGALLHWGQSNGLMTAKELDSRFPDTPEFPGRLDKWRAVQASLGGNTFTNLFMKRVGLATGS